MKLKPFVPAAMAIVVTLFGVSYFLGSRHEVELSGVLSKTAWQRMALPGELSRAHAFLGNNCAACHTAEKGVEASNCIACHANDEALLQRQPTAFHASVSSCVECHREHRGIDRRPTDMDHLALVKSGFRDLKADRPQHGEDRAVRKDLLDWVGQHQAVGQDSDGHSSLTPQEAVLNCVTCHSTKDRHETLFGQDCAQCHGTSKWTIPEFRHPSPKSMDCVQCHQAPPCHYMEMCFHMMSKVARQPSAEVSQCYKCHQTTLWNVIKGLGWSKSH